MSPLLAPLFAQLVSLQLGDRTEGRYADFNGDRRYEASSAPVIGLGVSSRETTFQLLYSPSLLMTPVDRPPRELYVFHQVAATAGYALKRTQVSFGSSFAIGSLNLKLIGVQGVLLPANGNTVGTGVPTASIPPTGTPTTTDAPTTGTGTTTPTPGVLPTNTPGGPVTKEPGIDQKVRFYVVTNTLAVTHLLSKNVRFTVTGSSSIASGMDEASRAFYPTLRGWSLGANTGYVYATSKRDSFNSNASFLKTWSSNDNEAATLNLTESWLHQFGPRTTGSIGAGFNVTRFSQPDNLAGFSVFPTFSASASHRVPLGRGGLSFSLAAYSSPALDPLRALVDPRVGLSGNIAYTRRKLTLSTSGGVSFSYAPEGSHASAVNSVQGEARASYAVASVASLDTGARIARQTYGDATVIPTSWAAFVGITLGYRKILAGGR
ncbi:MAG TPA: hypothetical protein VEQ59_22475 [Polyangiaceae bacterium]|nr:hypothetical protein [Polyangiaceae bacterium]